MPSSLNQHGRDGCQTPGGAAQADSDCRLDRNAPSLAGGRPGSRGGIPLRSASGAGGKSNRGLDLRRVLPPRRVGRKAVRRGVREPLSPFRQGNTSARSRCIVRSPRPAALRSAAETPCGESQEETPMPSVRLAAGLHAAGAAGRVAEEAPMPAAIGKYRVVQKLGSGGQAWVYRAVHPTLGRDVVIKLSRRKLEDDWNGLDRLMDEGRALAELDHPYLARIYDLDVYDRRVYLVMEYIPGKNLEQYAADSPVTFQPGGGDCYENRASRRRGTPSRRNALRHQAAEHRDR